VLGAPCDSTQFLKQRKNRKFMGLQDELLVVAAGRAIEAAGLAGASLGDRAGLYLAVGYIPFEREHVELLLSHSVDAAGALSMRRFSSDAFAALNPLLTFRCLPNMPAFHVSVNFDVQGPCVVSYPGAGQLYMALEEAVAALAAGEIEVALVGGVAHQRNFLVEHHHSRLDPPIAAESLRDAAACLVLERAGSAGGRGRARLLDLEVRYRAHDPFLSSPAPEQALEGAELPDGDLGAALLPALVSLNLGRELRHRAATRDGICARSAWGAA
jgi:hypothetical protein